MKKILLAILFCNVLFGASLNDIFKADSKAIKMARDICMEKNLVGLKTMAKNCYTLTRYNISEKDKFILSKRACDKGVAILDTPCLKTANFYEKGVGTSVDYTKAKEYSKKSFDLTMSTYEKALKERQRQMERIQEEGDKAAEEARKKFKGKYKGKKLQSIIEQHRKTKEGVQKELNDLLGPLFSNNGEDGQIDNLLAIHYENGIGTARDINKALKLYKQACSIQKGWGCNNYQRLKGAKR